MISRPAVELGLLCFTLAGFIYPGISLKAQDITNSSAADNCSVFQVALSYAEAIHSGDVLVLEREFYDGVHKRTQENGDPQLYGGTLETVTLTRTIFDCKGDRALVAGQTKFHWLDLAAVSSSNHGSSRKIGEWGYLVDRRNQKYRMKSQSVLLDVPWRDDLLLQEDPRVAGLSGTKFGPFNLSQKAFVTFATGDTLIDSRDTGKFLELRMNFGRDEGSKATDVRHFFFDHTNHLPIRSQRYMEFDKGGRTQPHDYHFEWKEHSGVFVATKAKSARYKSFEGPKREQWHGNVSAECFLQWLSVNQPIPESIFTGEDLTDQDKFAALIDPVKNNATSILEFLEKEKKEQEPVKDSGILSTENKQ